LIKKIAEIIQYRELLTNFVIKDLKVRYKSSALGFFWSLLNPLLMMLIFTFVFAHVFKTGVKNFPIFLLTGLLAWNYFNMAVAGGTASVLGNAALVKKIYFPRELLPIASVLAELVNFLIATLLLFVFLAISGYHFYLFIPLILLVIIIQTLFTIGVVLFLSGINVYFRDIQYIVNVVLMALFYATPILYTIDMVKKVSLFAKNPWLLTLYKVNPIASFMMLYRNMMFETTWPSWPAMGYAAAAALIALIVGYLTFNKLAPAFSEEL
jgi:lipopolysaccharide transport system permease protein